MTADAMDDRDPKSDPEIEGAVDRRQRDFRLAPAHERNPRRDSKTQKRPRRDLRERFAAEAAAP